MTVQPAYQDLPANSVLTHQLLLTVAKAETIIVGLVIQVSLATVLLSFILEWIEQVQVINTMTLPTICICTLQKLAKSILQSMDISLIQLAPQILVGSLHRESTLLISIENGLIFAYFVTTDACSAMDQLIWIAHSALTIFINGLMQQFAQIYVLQANSNRM